MTKNIKVSICIPAYENPKALDRLLASIAIQEYKSYLVYITDDSRNNSDELIVEKWKATEALKDKIVYEHNAVSKGPTANTNYCMKKAETEYLKIMHHDDCFSESTSLGKMVALLEDAPDADFAFAGTNEIYYDEAGNEIVEKRESKSLPSLEENQLKDSPYALYLGNFVEGPSTTIIRNKGIELDDSLKWLVDIDYYIRVLLKNNKYAFTREHLINMGHLATQVTESCLQDPEIIFNETKYVFCKYKLNFGRHVRYLCTMGAMYGKKYKDYDNTGISYFTYLNYKLRYNARKILRISKH